MKTTFQIALLGLLLGFTVSVATAHTGAPDASYWTNGSQLTAADLNNTVAHMHNTFNGGIVDSHISTTAGIQHSKLAKPGLIPKAMGYITYDGGATVEEDFNIASVTVLDAGYFAVTLDYTPTDAHFVVQVTPDNADSNPVACWVMGRAAATQAFNIMCKRDSVVVWDAVVGGFSVVVLDGD